MSVSKLTPTGKFPYCWQHFHKVGMTYKGVSFIVLFWGIFNFICGGLAYFYMGSFAQPLLISGALSGLLGFSLGHFINRGRKQAFILALATCLGFIFLFTGLTAKDLEQEHNYIFPDAFANPSRNVYLLISSAQLTSTVLVLLLLIIFIKPIYHSLQEKF